MSKSISDLVMEYFEMHPMQDLSHGPVVDWVEKQYVQLTGNKPRDPWREIRKLSQQGRLIKVRKGVYKYDPDMVHDVELLDFPQRIKAQIFKRDNYRCVVCGRGKQDGVEVTADHKVPKDKGGNKSLENGQTLCTEHNLLKKNYSRTEAGKRYFIQLYEDAIRSHDSKMIAFCDDVLAVYEKHHMNGHIKLPKA